MNRRAFQQLNKAYRDDALKVSVYGASSIGIVVMLYEGAIKAIRLAEQAIGERRYDVKSDRISKAIDILDGLRDALDLDNGSEVTRNLNDLYLYMKSRLSSANLKNDVEALAEVAGLLETLLPAWQQVDKQPARVAVGG